MQTSEQMADAFVAWAQSNSLSLKDTETLAQAAGHPATAELKTALSESDFVPEALGTLAACVAQLHAKSPVLERHFAATGVDIVATWALASPLRRGEPDPNEKRFQTWAEAESWETFFSASVVAVRVMMTYRRPFDLRTLYRWVNRYQREAGKGFAGAAKSTFQTWQAPADWVPTVDAARHDTDHCRSLITELHENGWERGHLADRLGITKQYLGLLARGHRSPSYQLQVALELLCGPAEATRLEPGKPSQVKSTTR